MLLRYAVSFESDLRPVRTARGEIDVPNPRLGVRRALEAAQAQCPKSHWRSIVVVIEKALPDPESVTEVVPDLREEVPDLGELGVHPIDVDQGQDDHQETDRQQRQGERG